MAPTDTQTIGEGDVARVNAKDLGPARGEVVGGGQLLRRAAEMNLDLAGVIASVPDGGEDAELSILSSIFNATDASDLDSPWRTDGLLALEGHVLRVDAIRKMPSDFVDGLCWFLFIDADDLTTGKRTTATTGATSVVGQLLRAWQIKAWPLVC